MPSTARSWQRPLMVFVPRMRRMHLPKAAAWQAAVRRSKAASAVRAADLAVGDLAVEACRGPEAAVALALDLLLRALPSACLPSDSNSPQSRSSSASLPT